MIVGRVRREKSDIFRLWQAVAVKPQRMKEYPFDELASALDLIEQGRSAAK